MYELNQLNNAIECYNESIKLNPNKSDFYFDKALALIKSEKHEETIPILNKVTELDPKNHVAFGELGN